MNIKCAFLLLIFAFVERSSAMKPRLQLRQSRGFVAVGIGLAALTTPVLAATDCNIDCFKNCVRVAPGSKAYCDESCSDYCAQPDRTDGLSGSKDASGGETGIFGGSIDGTVTAGDDKPPAGVKIIPDAMLKSSSKKFKRSG